MKAFQRFLFESSPWPPFLTAWLAGFVVIGGDGEVYLSEAGEAYLEEIDQ